MICDRIIILSPHKSIMCDISLLLFDIPTLYLLKVYDIGGGWGGGSDVFKHEISFFSINYEQI